MHEPIIMEYNNDFKMERNISIDISRFIFAFLVVVLHVPLLYYGGVLLRPFARCAVPFFFIISGFYLYSSDAVRLRARVLAFAKKWFSLWFAYTLILAFVAVIIDKYMGGEFFGWTSHDTIPFIKTGVCHALDIIHINGKGFGISTLWFLYAGAIAFVFFYFIRKYLNAVVVEILISVLLLCATSVNYYYFYSHPNSGVLIIRTISVAIPFIYAGYALRRHAGMIKEVSSAKVLYGIIFFTVTLYIEALFNRHIEVYFSTIPLTILIFIYLIRKPKLLGEKCSIPVKTAMDIYIWHRLVYALLFGFFRLQALEPMAAIIVFITVLAISYLLRQLGVRQNSPR